MVGLAIPSHPGSCSPLRLAAMFSPVRERLQAAIRRSLTLVRSLPEKMRDASERQNHKMLLSLCLCLLAQDAVLAAHARLIRFVKGRSIVDALEQVQRDTDCLLSGPEHTWGATAWHSKHGRPQRQWKLCRWYNGYNNCNWHFRHICKDCHKTVKVRLRDIRL